VFEIGFWEIVLVAVVALIVVGPERLPGLARTAGLLMGKARRMMADVKAEVDRELQLEDLKRTFRQHANFSDLKDVSDQVKSFREEIEQEFDDPGPPPGWRPGMATGAPSLPYTPESAPEGRDIPAATPVRLSKSDPRPADAGTDKPDSALTAPASDKTS